MNRVRYCAVVMIAMIAGLAGVAEAEPVDISAVMSPKQHMRLDFEDGSGRMVLLVRREGAALGSGLLAGTSVMEYGMHDLVPGVGGEPRGYLVFAAPDGAKVYVRFLIKAVFVPNPSGAPKFRLLDYGYWEVAGASGKFKGLAGVGTVTIKPTSKTDRKFTLTGELVPAP